MVRQSIYEDLFQNYQKDVRPEGQQTVALPVSIDMSVLSVSQLDNIKGTFELNAWFRNYWKDPRLRWLPEDYCGIQELAVSSDKVWMPDISYWILRSEPIRNTYKEVKVILSHTGDLFVSTARQDEIHCKLNLRSFPQDVQECNFTLGSWSYSSHDIILIPFGYTGVDGGLERTISKGANQDWFIPGIDLSNFNQRDTHSIRQIVVSCPSQGKIYASHVFSELNISVIIARESFTYINTVAWPLVIVTMIACLSPLYHPAAPGKSILTVTLLLTLTAIYITASTWIPKLNYPTALSDLYTSCLTFTAVLSLRGWYICLSNYHGA